MQKVAIALVLLTCCHARRVRDRPLKSLARFLTAPESAAAFKPAGPSSNLHLQGSHAARSLAPCMKISSVPVPQHEAYLKDVCGRQVPEGLACAVGLLVGRGEELVEPGKDKSIFPLLVPLTKSKDDGEVTGLMLWPFKGDGYEFMLPVVRTKGNQVVMLADNCKHYVANAAVYADGDADIEGIEDAADIIELAEEAGIKYEAGAAKVAPAGVRGYIIFKIGPCMPVYKEVARNNLKVKEDSELRTLVCCDSIERQYKDWGSSFVFQMRMMEYFASRAVERRDKARNALLLPFWTLDDDLEDVAKVHLKTIKDLREECKTEMTGTLPPEKLFMAGNVDVRGPLEKERDKAIALLNLVVTNEYWKDGEETWESVRPEVAKHFVAAGMPELATVVAME